jgi:hypothetical protein
MDVTMWRKIVEGWTKSHWGQRHELDHEPFEINMEMVNKLARKKEPKDETEV